MTTDQKAAKAARAKARRAAKAQAANPKAEAAKKVAARLAKELFTSEKHIVTSKTNHDSIWIKVEQGKEFAKVKVTRRGVYADFTPTMKALATEMFEYMDKGVGSYGELFVKLEADLKARFA